jgi:hypothetical protein
VNDKPSTKRPKRWKSEPAPLVKAPKGFYHTGIHDLYILMRVGAICGMWTHVEETITDFFDFLLGGIETGRPVLRSIVSQEAYNLDQPGGRSHSDHDSGPTTW